MENSLREYNLDITKKVIAEKIMKDESFKSIATYINKYDSDTRIKLIVSAMVLVKIKEMNKK
jgi:hypothetical protein